MKLITEFNDVGISYITEGAEKNVYIEGIFMQAEKPNRNRRIYPRDVLEEAVGKYVKEQVATGRAVGELNHPEGPSINLDKVSHRITELNWDKDDVYGKALILDTPMGLIVKGLLKGGVKLGVSSRGMGSIVSSTSKGISKVDRGYQLNTVDIVQDPSAPSAFVEGIMEGVEYFYEGNEWIAATSDKFKGIISGLSVKQIAEQQSKLFADFLKEISLNNG